MAQIKYILFDAANTLIHKPSLWITMQEALSRYGYNTPIKNLQIHHKIISELTDFPDKTNERFYRDFNTKLLHSLGIITDGAILTQLFQSCSYLPWLPFDDTSILHDINLPLGVLSNFKKELSILLNNLFTNNFSDIIISEEENIRKPDIRFFELAVKKIGLQPNEILYIGDSYQSDYLPASHIGINALIIDRIGTYCASDYTITNLNQLHRFIQ
jgi:FMN phosphatase YigB (HAD superfamily)